MNATAKHGWLTSPAMFDAVVTRVEAAKAEGVDVALDFHGRLHKPMAKQLARRVEPLDLLFIEEPLLSEHVVALEKLSRLTTIPIALGNVCTRAGTASRSSTLASSTCCSPI